MRIGGLSARPPRADDVAAALSGAAALLGQRPAITGLVPAGRREQGFASLAGWVAKGANLLTLELGLGPGSRVALAGPPGWPLATVALSAWWVGATVISVGDPDAASADVSVVHAAIDVPRDGTGGERFLLGDELDGTDRARSGPDEQWTDAVTPHGDRPPAPVHDGSLIAIVDGSGAAHPQRLLLDAFADDPGDVMGVARSGDVDVVARQGPATLLAVLALRPLVTGATTVVVDVDDPERDAHERAERIARWSP